MKKIAIALTALFATLGTAQAQTAVQAPTAVQAQTTAPTPAPLRFFIGLGKSAGGDSLITLPYENGGAVSIYAGGAGYVTFGADYRLMPDFSLQGSVNYHVVKMDANNGSIKFERYPIELIGYYQISPAWRAGAGLRYSINPRLIGDGVVSNVRGNYDDSIGAIVEGEFFATRRIGIKLRLVKETIKLPGYGNYDGSHVGLSGNFYF